MNGTLVVLDMEHFSNLDKCALKKKPTRALAAVLYAAAEKELGCTFVDSNQIVFPQGWASTVALRLAAGIVANKSIAIRTTESALARTMQLLSFSKVKSDLLTFRCPAPLDQLSFTDTKANSKGKKRGRDDNVNMYM